MNLKGFFVATLGTALDLGIATADDVLRHVTPDVLSIHLPRPLWARLLTACLGAPRVDAQLVVETVGVPNLCEHVPAQIIWGCIHEIGERSLGGVVMATSSAPASRPNASATTPVSRPIPLATPPPPPATEPRVAATSPLTAVGPSIPSPAAAAAAASGASAASAVSASDSDADPASRRVPAGQRFRQSSTGIGRLAASNPAGRRPQAQATPPAPAPAPIVAAAEPPRAKRGQTESDFEIETVVGGKDDWKNVLAVEDEQLVDWSASDETVTNGDELSRKR